MTTAREAGLISCHFCHTLSKLPETREAHAIIYCPCCQSSLHSRYPDSLRRTWALLVAAFILYIPANTFPIMTFVYLGEGQPETILSGVMHLLAEGLWPLALLIFIASIFIPILKLFTLLGLLLSIHFKTHWRPKDRTVMYRVTEFVGRWSMVDIFVIALLVALVQFGNSATVTPDIGALAFAAVVILTMFAAHTFDPRLIWDIIETNQCESENNNGK